MNNVTLLKEFGRMCKDTNSKGSRCLNCSICTLSKRSDRYWECPEILFTHSQEVLEIVEEWSNSHPDISLTEREIIALKYWKECGYTSICRIRGGSLVLEDRGTTFQSNIVNVFSNDFTFIKAEDDKPFLIDDLLATLEDGADNAN